MLNQIANLLHHDANFTLIGVFIAHCTGSICITVYLICIVLYLGQKGETTQNTLSTSRDQSMYSNAWFNGLLGVLIFSGSLPATRLAVMGFSPEFLSVARALIAALLALIALILFKQKPPSHAQYLNLIWVVLGVVIGFPWFTALALQHIQATQSIIFIGLLPLFTALFGILWGETPPQKRFWLFALAGSTCLGVYVYLSADISHDFLGNLYMLLSVLLCGLGYTAGAQLSRQLGSWQVIAWALVISIPLMLPLSYIYFPKQWSNIPLSAYAGLIYVALFSMFIGFIFWYRALALGGVVKISQLQLLQPFFGLILASVLLNEKLSFGMFIVSGLIVFFVYSAKKYA